MSDDVRPYGLLAEFETAGEIYSACETVRDAGYSAWDAHTPFPVHGLDNAMGLPRSRLPWIVLVCGLLGASGAMFLQWWVHAVRYKLIIAAKPYFSWPAFIPVTFEVMVLFSAAGAVFGMLALNRLPRHHHRLFNSERFNRVTDDRFFISIEASDPHYDPAKTRALLEQAGAKYIEVVE